MSKPFSKSKLEHVRTTATETKLEGLRERNVKPFEGAKKALTGNELLKPYTTGNATRDLMGIESQLNHYPDQLSKLSERELDESWKHAEKIGKAAAWIKGHIVLVTNRKFGEKSVEKFAQRHSVGKRIIYNYLHLAEMFPKVDPILEPSFHFKAMDMAHGDKNKTIKLIEMARDKKISNPKYSVRDFMGDAEKKISKRNESDNRTEPVDLIKKITKILAEIKLSKNIKQYKKDLLDLKSEIELILKQA